MDYRNLATEELGGVYEGLLELTQRVSGDGADFTLERFAASHLWEQQRAVICIGDHG